MVDEELVTVLRALLRLENAGKLSEDTLGRCNEFFFFIRIEVAFWVAQLNKN